MRAVAISIAILALASCAPPEPEGPLTPEQLSERASDLDRNATARSWLDLTPEEKDAVAALWAGRYLLQYGEQGITFDTSPEATAARDALEAQLRTCADRGISPYGSLTILDAPLMRIGGECIRDAAAANGAPEPRNETLIP
jgi:hypothetical protein